MNLLGTKRLKANLLATKKPKRIFHDIYESIRYSRWQRNQLAAVIAFVSGIMFLISGYRADVTLYYSIQKEVLANLPNNIWTVVIIPIGILAWPECLCHHFVLWNL